MNYEEEQKVFFQQDGAAAYISRENLEFLEEE